MASPNWNLALIPKTVQSHMVDLHLHEKHNEIGLILIEHNVISCDSCAASGIVQIKRYMNYWLHNKMISLNGE